MKIKTQTNTLLTIAGIALMGFSLLLTYVFAIIGSLNITARLTEVILLGAIIVALPVFNVLYLKKRLRENGIQIDSKEKETTKMYVDHLYNEIRGKIHDYNNHLQVLYGLLLKEDRYTAKKYMDELMEDVTLEYETLKTNQPAIDSLLHYKKSLAQSRGIETDLYISTDLKNFVVKTSEFCRALGNIINNSIEILTTLEGDKNLVIIIRKDNGYIFEIINNGPSIPQEVQENLFQPGYTTKKSGQGLGLYTAYQITEKLGGQLTVESNDEETSFKIYFPGKTISYALAEENELLLTSR